MNPSPAAASFESLPTEIVLNVLCLAPSLPSLHAIVLASPNASRVFTHGFGQEILNHVLRETTVPQIMTVIRHITLVRQPTPGFRSLRALWASPAFRHARDLYDSGDGQCLPDTPGTQGSCSPREILTLARRVALLADSCLRYYREQSRTAVPLHLDNNKLLYHRVGRLLQRPRSHSFEPRDAGRPSWMETQRMLRGIWRLQLFYEVKKAAHSRRFNWTNEELWDVSQMNAGQFYDRLGVEREEVLTAIDFIKSRTPTSQHGAIHHRHSLPTLHDMTSWPDGAAIPNGQSLNELAFRLRCPAAGYRYFEICACYSSSPIRGVPFWPYRELGFAIWDDERLAALGYLNVHGTNEPVGTMFGGLLFTWKSILSPEIMAEL